MPELPELVITRERLAEALGGRRLLEARVHDPFVLRTVAPPLAAAETRTLDTVSQTAKFIRLQLGPRPDGDGPDRVDLAIHLMLGGRLHLKRAATWKPHRKPTLFSASWEGDVVLELTEAGSKRKASLRVMGPEDDRTILERGVDPFSAALDAAAFGCLLRERNQQIKRALTDPDRLAGIGNAYSDEILFAARLSPLKLTSRLTDEEVARLLDAVRHVLAAWIERVRSACPKGLPTRQADWRREMAVHGRPGEPCPVCGGPIARISRKDSEAHYCPVCQNEGCLLADRRLSRFGIRRPPPAPGD